ncbi:HNH endonuclease [Perilla frutescens var. hirtella]|nr:HNH endonuclease [Perilla frutescens var. frutescens]KAH6801173.1 HNH endonuclease [Perilla frutescens var. hirtella]
MSPNSSTAENNRTRTKKGSSYPSSRRARPASPNRRLSPPPSAATLADGGLLTEELSRFESLHLSPESSNPRSFPYNVKQQCWEKAEKIKGRAPDRWRRDPLGNIVFRKLVGCPGCLCHDYDHIVPYSKGGKSTLENCQVLQATVNRSKGNRTEVSKSELIQKSAYCRVSGRDMDLLELSAYGNVRRGQDSDGENGDERTNWLRFVQGMYSLDETDAPKPRFSYRTLIPTRESVRKYSLRASESAD